MSGVALDVDPRGRPLVHQTRPDDAVRPAGPVPWRPVLLRALAIAGVLAVVVGGGVVVVRVVLAPALPGSSSSPALWQPLPAPVAPIPRTAESGAGSDDEHGTPTGGPTRDGARLQPAPSYGYDGSDDHGSDDHSGPGRDGSGRGGSGSGHGGHGSSGGSSGPG